MNKKQIFLWALYDFANSIVVGVFALYFSQWLVIDNQVSDLWFNMIFFGASLMLIFAGPIGGAVADKFHTQMWFIRSATAAQYAFGVACALVTLFAPPGQATAIAAALCFMAILFFYQFSLGFYNALLPELAPPGKQGLVSGIGQAANWLGQLFGLLLTLPFASGAIYFFGATGRAQPLLPAVILFILCSLPMLIWFKQKNVRVRGATYAVHKELKTYWEGFKATWALPGVGLFLLAFFFFNDALLTTANNFPIYIEQVFGVSDTIKVYMLLGILFTSAVGGLVGGWVADKVGLRRSLLFILGFWILFFPALGITTNFSFFVGAVVTMGFLYGATWSVTRAVMAVLLPPEQLNRGFSYFTLFERFSTFVGPVAWGLITTGLVQYGSARYQFAAIFMSVFVIVGFMLARRIRLAR